jgi:hypothetical protein
MPLFIGFRGAKSAWMTPRRRMAALISIPIGKRPGGTYADFAPIDFFLYFCMIKDKLGV